MSMLNDLYLPDRKKLTTMITGRPGSGKSKFIEITLSEFLKSNKDPELRIVFFCPKQEMVLGEKNIVRSYDLEKHLRKNRVAVVYPDPFTLEEECDYCVDLMFDIQQANPKFKAVFICDDAQIFLSSRRQASNSLKRLALTGRSKGIRFVAVSHTMVFSKDLEGSTSYIVNFTMPVKLYHRDSMIRYGFDPEPYVEALSETPYSYVWFDVTKANARLMKPLELKGSAKIQSIDG